MYNIIKSKTNIFSLNYTQNKIMFSLSILLLLFIFIIIRFCQYPLLIHTQILEKLFISTSSDNTIYNIAISYVAAYIFYIFQVYIPAMLSHCKSYNLLSANIYKEIELLQKICFICKNSLTNSEDKYIFKSKNPIYFITEFDNNTYLHKFTYNKSYNLCKEQLMTLHNHITSNPNLSHLDYAFLYKYSFIPINEFFTFMDNIYKRTESNTEIKISSVQILYDLEKAISDCINTYGFRSSTIFNLNVSEEQKEKYNNACKQSNISEYLFAIRI